VRWPLRRALWLAAPLVAGLIGWGWWRGVTVQRETRRELEELRLRRDQLARASSMLEREVRSLRNEPEARARAARESLDVAAPDEVLVILPLPAPTRGAR